MLTVLLLFSLIICVVLNSAATQEAPQIYLPYSSTSLDLPVYPYQEDLISSIKYLKDEPAIKDEKVRGLINLMKTMFAKQLDQSYKEITSECTIPHADTAVEQLKNIKEISQTKNLATEIENTTYVAQKSSNHQNSGNIESTVNNEEHHNTPSNIVPIFRIKLNNNMSRQNSEPLVLETNSQQKLYQHVRENVENLILGPFPKSVPLEPSDTNIKVENRLQNVPMFNIPCQKVSDILEETPRFVIPKEAYCENTRSSMNVEAKGIKPISMHQEPVVTHSITCTESDETVAMLFKPKTISLKQVYGNLLKKITVNVLVPYHVSKITL